MGGGEQFTELLGLSIDELRSKVQLRLSELIEYLISLLIPPRLPPSWWPRPLGAPLVSLLLVKPPFSYPLSTLAFVHRSSLKVDLKIIH